MVQMTPAPSFRYVQRPISKCQSAGMHTVLPRAQPWPQGFCLFHLLADPSSRHCQRIGFNTLSSHNTDFHPQQPDSLLGTTAQSPTWALPRSPSRAHPTGGRANMLLLCPRAEGGRAPGILP